MDTNEKVMITTRDNPYHPIKDFDSWYSWDESHGYHTCQLIDSFAHTHDSMSENEMKTELMRAYKEICGLLYLVYKMIREDEEVKPEQIEIPS